MSAAVIDPSKSVSAEVSVDRWSQGSSTHTTDQVAEEVPVALIYHNVPHVVMLATPANFEDYAVGFTLSEGLVAHPDEIREVEVGAVHRIAAPETESHRKDGLRSVRSGDR
jgi:FdhD protein